MITQERLKEVLNYDPDSGAFTWKIDRGPSRVGLLAGGIGHKGCVRICIDLKLYFAHRLAWLYINGHQPAELNQGPEK